MTPRRSGNAPQRNLIRRRLKAIFYEEKLYQGPYDCIIFVTQEAVKTPFPALRELLTKTLKP